MKVKSTCICIFNFITLHRQTANRRKGKNAAYMETLTSLSRDSYLAYLKCYVRKIFAKLVYFSRLDHS